MYIKKKLQNHGIFVAILLALIFLILIVSILLVLFIVRKNNAPAETSIPTTEATTVPPTTDPPTAYDKLVAFAQERDLPLSAWPDSLLELLDKNPEATEFVLQYPLKKDLQPQIDMSEYVNCQEVPLLLQWDERWGYSIYGNEVMGITGCAPTCLSMVCMYLLQDPLYSPRYIAEFAQQNGYYVPGSGSSWTLISEGGPAFGLEITELPLVKAWIVEHLEAGDPIICAMGPGDFTEYGHFIVMTDYVDGKIKINDPNSLDNSNTLWDYEAIESQICNLWVCR